MYPCTEEHIMADGGDGLELDSQMGFIQWNDMAKRLDCNYKIQKR